jgi:cytochrome c553
MPRFSAIPALLLAAAALCVSPLAGAQAVPKPAKLGLCTACHGEDGRGRTPGTPHLAGQDEAYLRSALAAYRSGARRVPPMTAIAGTLQPKDIQALARWYATRPPARTK